MATITKDKDDLTGFASRLRALRMQKGWSQTELAEKLSVHSNHISRYERGETKPSTSSLKALADCLGVSADYLIDGNEENAAVANFADSDLLKMFAEVENFSEKEKQEVKGVLDAFITRHKVKNL